MIRFDKNIRNKKAQHEIVGFILIVVIVMVIGLFLLVYFLRQEPVKHESLDVQNFLQSSMEYTTTCAISFEPQYDSVQDLIKNCYNNRKCLNDEMACSVLNDTLSELVQGSWLASSGRPVNAYSILINYIEENEDNGTYEELGEAQKDEILSLNENWQNCTGNRVGAEHLISSYPGNIIVSLEICYT